MAFAASALLQFSGNITNFATVSSSNSFQGWSAASAPCTGWTGILCDSYGQVTDLYAPLFFPHMDTLKGHPTTPWACIAVHLQISVAWHCSITHACLFADHCNLFVLAACRHSIFESIPAAFVVRYVSCIFSCCLPPASSATSLLSSSNVAVYTCLHVMHAYTGNANAKSA